MSLKEVHILFIFASILLCAFFTCWAYAQYGTHNTTGYLVTSIVSGVLTVALSIYGIYFIKKAKTL